MSMSTHVVGIKEPTEQYRKMYEAYRACEEAGVSAPTEVLKFFGYVRFNAVDQNGMEVDLDNGSESVRGCVVKYAAGGQSGYEVDVTKLPVGITRIRFYNSY